MKIHTSVFGAAGGETVHLTRMESDVGITVETLSLGGIIHRFIAPDRDGKPGDIVLGHENLQDGYLAFGGYAAAVIGRCANRIDGAEYTYRGQTHTLEKNYLGHSTLHGASGNYAKRYFSVREEALDGAVRVIYTAIDHGEAGFPGAVDVTVRYTLHADGMLTMELHALPEQDTVLNLTNHAYFNLGGHDGGDVSQHLLLAHSDFYLPARKDCTPTGEVLSVEGTVFDFRKPRALGQGLSSDDPQIKLLGTYDHHLCIRGFGMRDAMVACDPVSGRRMTIRTDLPGAQLYVPGERPKAPLGKGGVRYGSRQGFCFETQGYPNAPNQSQFPSVFVDAGKAYCATTAYLLDTVTSGLCI